MQCYATKSPHMNDAPFPVLLSAAEPRQTVDTERQVRIHAALGGIHRKPWKKDDQRETTSNVFTCIYSGFRVDSRWHNPQCRWTPIYNDL